MHTHIVETAKIEWSKEDQEKRLVQEVQEVAEAPPPEELWTGYGKFTPAAGDVYVSSVYMKWLTRLLAC